MCGKVSKKPAKNTLAAKRKNITTHSNVIRTVLADPSTLNCPTISQKNSLLIKEKFKNLFMYTPPEPIPWVKLKNLSKEERKEIKKSKPLYKINPKDCNMVLGANAVTRSLEKKEATLVLLTHDYQPQLLLKHLIQMCNLYNVHVAKVHDLRNIGKECFGFSILAAAFKTIKKTNPVFEVMHMIKQFLPPVWGKRYEELVDMELKHTQPESENPDMEEVYSHMIETDSEEISEMQANESDSSAQSSSESKSSPGIILYRDSTNVRTFVPEKTVSEPVRETEKRPMDYISLAEYSDSEEIRPKKRKKYNVEHEEDSDTVDEPASTSKAHVELPPQKMPKRKKKSKKTTSNERIFKPLKVKRLKKNVNRKTK